MPFVSSGGKPHYPSRAEIRHDEVELAEAILHGAAVRPEQAFGHYFEGRRASCALGAAYEGMYRLPTNTDLTGERPTRDLEWFFDCLEGSVRKCPGGDGCTKTLSLASILVHLNDTHRWSREQIAAWLDELK